MHLPGKKFNEDIGVINENNMFAFSLYRTNNQVLMRSDVTIYLFIIFSWNVVIEWNSTLWRSGQFNWQFE